MLIVNIQRLPSDDWAAIVSLNTQMKLTILSLQTYDEGSNSVLIISSIVSPDSEFCRDDEFEFQTINFSFGEIVQLV